MRINLSDTQNRTVFYVLFPLAFYYAFLTSIYVLMKTTVLSEDLLFIRFYALTGVFLGFFLWWGSSNSETASSLVVGMLGPLFIMTAYFCMKAFLLNDRIDWDESDFMGAISFSALLGNLLTLFSACFSISDSSYQRGKMS
ncbi:hypothetical protein EHW64_18065 [Erwinia psidii]|uniref:hypothetical protein n=1 Tax=Erwinia psidii TaxID=69224 RepID=UPI00226BAC63|nr:hypothetical protein [Erwinia psidii]MCX8962970.1 hypothetical protein [Erwinia psidii]